jgi:uncharacterized membrane protein YeaQ/YmgE (transglycosylase-associated protein family)
MNRSKIMSIIAWLILGLIAGFIGSKIVNRSGEGVLLDIGLGVVGALVGGFLFSLIGAAPVTGLNIYSLIVAVVGSIVVLLIYYAITGRNRTVV